MQKIFAYLFWPLDQIDTMLERRWWQAECAQFDELRGFSLEDLPDQEEQWTTITKPRPAAY